MREVQASRNVVLFTAMSLDGYIADENDSLDWLFKVEGEGDNGYSAFYDTVDTIIMGKRTYDWIIRHETGEFPYKGKDCYIITTSTEGKSEDVCFINPNLTNFTNQL